MIYVTSDLHGIHPDAFRTMLERAGFAEEDFLFILGDVIDRGEHGAELLLWLTNQPNMQLILGNHEALLMACDFLFDQVSDESLTRLTPENMALLENWIFNGGAPTLKGLRGLLDRDPELIEGILDYLRDAPLYECVRAGGRSFILVHAGLGNFHPARPLDSYGLDELTMMRPDLTDRYFPNATVICGHTPTEFYGMKYVGRALHTDTWIDIDTGAACGRTPMLLRLDDMKEFY